MYQFFLLLPRKERSADKLVTGRHGVLVTDISCGWMARHAACCNPKRWNEQSYCQARHAYVLGSPPSTNVVVTIARHEKFCSKYCG